jgi:chromosome segregation ATPase
VATVPEQDQMESKRRAALELLETQKKRLEQLNVRRNKIQVTVEAARQQYEQAVQEAVTEHETAELDQLRAKLVALETENTNVLADFVKAVDQYEKFIVRIETALNDPEAMSALLSSLEAAGVALAAGEKTAAPVEAAPAAVAFDEADI